MMVDIADVINTLQYFDESTIERFILKSNNSVRGALVEYFNYYGLDGFDQNDLLVLLPDKAINLMVREITRSGLAGK